jgi:hypothetical protein
MPTLLSTVEAVFQIAGRGCVVVPGIPREGTHHVRIGDPLILKLPNGQRLDTHVRGIEMLSPPRPEMPILLGSELTKAQIPVGTELWLP